MENTGDNKSGLINQTFFGYIRVTTLDKKTDVDLFLKQRTELESFFEQLEISKANVEIQTDVGPAENGEGQDRLINYFETMYGSGKNVKNIVVYSLDRFCRSTELLEGLIQYMEILGASLLCLKEKVCYLGHHNIFFDWEKYGFFYLGKGPLTQNVWLKEQEIKKSKDRIRNAKMKRTCLGLDFKHVPLGVLYTEEKKNEKEDLENSQPSEDYKIITLILYAASENPRLEEILAMFNRKINIDNFKRNLDMGLEDSDDFGCWSHYRIARFLNLLKLKDENGLDFTEIKIRNLLFYWSLLKVQELEQTTF